MSLSVLEVTLRLVVALILGGLIGLERESHGRPAGFRTHIIVAVSSTLIMIVSAYGFVQLGDIGSYEPGRIAAQVVSGIGFLGAGTIMREGANIRGLTTAASLWSVAGIGLSVGIGLYYPAIIATVIVVLTLIFLNRIELGNDAKIIRIITRDKPGQLAEIYGIFAQFDFSITHINLHNDSSGNSNIELTVCCPQDKQIALLFKELTTNISEITSVTLE